MARCLVTRPLHGDAIARLAERHDVEVRPGAAPASPEELRAAVHEVEGLLTLLTDRVDQKLLDAAPRLRVIANYAVGTDNIDLEACARRGIAVGCTPDVLTDATADLAFALILAAARRVLEASAAVRKGEWRTWEPQGWLGVEVTGATLGIVGYGRIGRAVARRAEGFGMRVLHTSRSGGVPLGELLAESDFVSLHAPLTEETHHLIGREALATMKPTAILVNTARGPLVDTNALIVALYAGSIGGAALDVTDPEPLPAGHPLLVAPNVLVVPHIGSATDSTRARMTAMAVDNLLAGLDGLPLPHPA